MMKNNANTMKTIFEQNMTLYNFNKKNMALKINKFVLEYPIQ